MKTSQRPVTIAVVGGTGAGKTTISRAILDRVGSHHIAYIPHDAYYKDLQDIPLTSDNIRNFDHLDALDNDLMTEHIKLLQTWQPADIPTYDFAKYCRLPDTRRVDPQPIILIEGILTLAKPRLRSLCDIKIFVDIDADIRLIRRMQRDIQERGRTVDSVINQYLTTVRPMHLQFVEPSRRYADVIVPEGGYNTVAIDMVADRIQSMLHAHLGEPPDSL